MRNVARIGLGVPALCLSLLLTAPAGATVYLSPAGSDTAACTQAAPCKSFDRGYRVAPAGSDVELATGSYSEQNLTNLPVKSSAAKVVFRPAAGASVRVDYVDIVNSDNIEVRSVATSGWGIRNGSAHIILRDVSATDTSATAGYFAGSDDVQIIGGEIARVDPEDGIHMNNAGGSNSNITIDGLFIHDLTRDRDPSAHDDCIQTGDVTNLVIRNSRFFNCGTQGIFLNPYNGGATKNITLENNWFGKAQLGYNIVYVGEAQNVVMRNNSFTGSMYVDGATASGVKMINNILDVDAYTCQTMVWPRTCSTTTSRRSRAAAPSTTSSRPTSTISTPRIAQQRRWVRPAPQGAGAAAIGKGLERLGRQRLRRPGPADRRRRPTSALTSTGRAHSVLRAPIPARPGRGTGGGGTGGGSGGGTGGGSSTTTPGSTKPPPATAASNVLASLPASTAASFRAVDQPKIGTKQPLALAGVDDVKICRVARKGCKAATRLRIAVTSATKVNLVFRKVRPGHRMKIVRVTKLKLHKGANVVRITGRGLAKARYHLIVRAPNGASVDVPLTVG